MRPRFRLIGRTDMPQGSCEMAWEDGGAIRNAGELIEKIRLELERFVPPAPPDENKPPEEPETGDSPDPENNVITKGKDSRDTPAQPDLETGDNHE